VQTCSKAPRIPTPTLDHERLDVDRLSIADVAFLYRIASSLSGTNRQTRDQRPRAARLIPRNIADCNGKPIAIANPVQWQATSQGQDSVLSDRSRVGECATIHELLQVCDSLDDDSNGRGQSDRKRIVSMLTQMAQSPPGIMEDRMEYEYRDAEDA
jgi:hypothetical protein